MKYIYGCPVNCGSPLACLNRRHNLVQQKSLPVCYYHVELHAAEYLED